MDTMTASAIAEGILPAVARRGGHELVERVVLDHIESCGPESVLRVALALAEREEDDLDHLAVRVAQRLAPEGEQSLCREAQKLGEKLEQYLSTSRRAGTRRCLAARSDLREGTISRLRSDKDAGVAANLAVSTAHTTESRLSAGNGVPVERQQRWCLADPSYRARVYRDPVSLGRLEQSSEGVGGFVPSGGHTAEDEAYLVSTVETLANQPRSVRDCFAVYLATAELSDAVQEAVVRAWSTGGCAELAGWVRERFLRCFDTEAGENGRVLREIERLGPTAACAWNSTRWLDVVLAGNASRNCALASPYLPAAAHEQAVRGVLEGGSATRSTDAAALILNPGTSSEERDDLIAHVKERHAALLFYAELSPETRGRLLAGSPDLLETAIMLWHSATVCRRVDEFVLRWFTAEVACSYLQHCFGSEATPRLYAKYANIVIELDGSTAEALAGSALCTFKVGGRLAEEIAARIQQEVLHPTTFSGLLHRWHGSVDQLITGSRKLHS